MGGEQNMQVYYLNTANSATTLGKELYILTQLTLTYFSLECIKLNYEQ